MVELHVEPDPGRSLGHARIIVRGLTPPPASADFVIRREGYQEANLGRMGWQVREEPLKPVAIEEQAGATVLIVSPAITGHLEPMPYIFQIPASGIESHMFWPEDIDNFDGELQRPERLDTTAEEITPSRKAAAQSAPEPPPEPQQSASATSVPDVETSIGGVGTETHNGANLKVIGTVIVVVFIVIVSAVLFWRYRQQQLNPPPVEITQPPGPVGPVTSPPPPVRPPQPPGWPEGTDALSPRDIVARAPNAAAIYAVAMRRAQSGKYDDALQLLEEAAEQGHVPAFAALAKLYDPNGFVAGRPFRNPDPRTAAKYYKEALDRGDTAVAAPREALRSFLEREANAGNGSAATALKDYWP